MQPDFFKGCFLFLTILMNISILASFTKEGFNDKDFPIEFHFYENVKFALTLNYKGTYLLL